MRGSLPLFAYLTLFFRVRDFSIPMRSCIVKIIIIINGSETIKNSIMLNDVSLTDSLFSMSR